MISIKSEADIAAMRRAGHIAGLALKAGGEAVRPGVSTRSIDAVVREVILAHGATPSFLGYRGYPAAACVSVNEEVIHGIPSGRKLLSGDLVSIDVGAFIDGFHGDTAATFAVGEVSEESLRLMEVTKECFFKGVLFAREGHRISDISRAVQHHAEQNGFSAVYEFTGHGVGRALHEDPEVPNVVSGEGRGPRLLRGMTFAIEPMINMGTGAIRVLSDGWTVVTADKRRSAHYEHTVLVTSGEPELLTLVQ